MSLTFLSKLGYHLLHIVDDESDLSDTYLVRI